MNVGMRKFYQLLIILLATQFAGVVYGMEDNLGDIESTNDVEMINKLEQIGQVVQRYAYPHNEAYFLIRRDAVEVVPGKEHFEVLQFLLNGLGLFATGALLPSVITVTALVKIFIGPDSQRRDELNFTSSFKYAVGLLATNALIMYVTPYLAEKCAKQWQIMPECLNIEARKVIKEQFWYLYPEGEKLECRVENSWLHHMGNAMAFMSGLSLGIWGNWKMSFRS